ncbi:MAG: hypothetical protein KA149_09440 [Chitinophagales bacterium]|nr:hypothetical protein [Chitinophagales bacterium]
MTPPIEKQINNLCAKIKSHYPNLYQGTGGKYIRKTLRTMLEASDNTSDTETNYAGGGGNNAYRKNSHRQ